MADALQRYRAKRDFTKTREPQGGRARGKQLSFVIQKHAARRLHYDFRLELDGTLKSWAVPKGPSLDPADKRMAVHVEDHPLDYASFEGTIPPGQYGAGTVIVWDRGTWTPVGDPREGYAAGKLKFALDGEKLQGHWTLVRMHGRAGEKQEPWLLIKEKDDEARPAAEYSVIEALPDSVLSGTPVDAPPAAKPARKGAARQPLPARAKRAEQRAARAAEDVETDAAPAKRPARKRAAAEADAPALPAGARRAKLPLTLAPQLATLVDRPPPTGDWLYEMKFDGYRLLARIDAEGVRLFTRNGHDWTAKLRRVASAVKALGLPAGWLDGEIIVPDARGVPDFQLLQNALDESRGEAIQYYVFDLPFYDGHDLREVPLAERRALLQTLTRDAPDPRLRFSESFDASPKSLLHSACTLHMEGVIGKRADAPYSTGRAASWIKLKCTQRQEFVIIGYTDPQGSRTGLGALALGVHDAQGKLHYVGNVGTGFTQETLRDLAGKLAKLRIDKTQALDVTRDVKANWVKPKLVAEVSFAGWTRENKVRQGVFHGLRSDKPAETITLERPAEIDARGRVTRDGAADGHVDAANDEAAATPRKTARPATKRAAADAPAETAKAATKTPAKAAKKTAAKTTSRRAAAEDDDGAVPTSLKITHGERVIDDTSGVTKRELIEYYARAADFILPHLARRPVSLVRAPDGIAGQKFFQKHDDKLSIPGMKHLDPAIDTDHQPLLEVASVKALLSAAQMNVVEFHTWNATTRAIEQPDRMTFDLDPGEGVTWKKIVEGALLVRALLEELDLVGFLKTSGGKGLHVVVPIKPRLEWDAVKDLSQAVVAHLSRTLPARFVVKSGPKNRVGKIFVDYLRNGRGATTVAAWSARARPGLGVSVPLAWEELETLKRSDQWTVRNAHERFEVDDPWADYEAGRRDVESALRALGDVARAIR